MAGAPLALCAASGGPSATRHGYPLVRLPQSEQSHLEFDDLVIGSGLSALGTVLGLSPARRVLVIAGPETLRTLFYEPTSAVPSAHLGHGGLGNFWHGVIPTGGRENFAASQPAEFEQLCAWFYPGLQVAARLGKPFLFVPWKPIRPANAWLRLGA